MPNTKPRFFLIALSAFLALAAIAMTIILPSLFVTDVSARPATWHASIVIACALEALIALYAALPFFPRFREGMSMAVYPSIAFILLPYALAVSLTLFFAAGHMALYATLLSGETFLAILVVCGLAAIGSSRRGVEKASAVARVTAYKPALEILSARNALAALKGKGSEAAFKSCNDSLRYLEERAVSSARFGRPGSESAEAEIESSIASLVAKISAINSLATTDVDSVFVSCASTADIIRKAFDVRERSLVK